ncbi:hypothetical protein JX266_012530 [Neoarthrinium moseri]|nr:hypothetical protein JX266_012530 [Neoarthrinium moseri]
MQNVAAPSPGILACATATVLVAGMIVFMRLYTRRYLVGMTGAEDWFILIALLFSAANSAGTIAQSAWALGQPLDTVSDDQIAAYRRAEWITTLFYNLSLAATKISILLLYVRALTYESFRRATLVILVTVVIVTVGIFAVIMTACIPIHKYWDPNIAGYCHPRSLWWAVTGFNTGSDVLILLLPAPLIFGLTLPRTQKLGLLAVFTGGLFNPSHRLALEFGALKELHKRPRPPGKLVMRGAEPGDRLRVCNNSQAALPQVISLAPHKDVARPGDFRE